MKTKSKAKAKLKRLGNAIYSRYFYNPDDIIEKIVYNHKNNVEIDESICYVIFDVSDFNINKVQELILYYPQKLKEKRIITDNVIDEIYTEFNETIEIMKTFKSGKLKSNVRGKMCANAQNNAKKRRNGSGIEFNITSEDIKLNKTCPILGIQLEYGNSIRTNASASLDRIDNTKGYLKNNVTVISLLANQMKSSANKEQLLMFAKYILENFKK